MELRRDLKVSIEVKLIINPNPMPKYQNTKEMRLLQVQNKHGEVGFIPSNYVKEKDALGLQNYDWYGSDTDLSKNDLDN